MGELVLLSIYFIIFSIANLFKIKEKLKQKNIIKSYFYMVKKNIENNELREAEGNLYAIKSIIIGSIRELDAETLINGINKWFYLYFIDKPTWVKNVLENEFPDLFSLASQHSPQLTKEIYNEIFGIMRETVRRKDIEKFKKSLNLFERSCLHLSREKDISVLYAVSGLGRLLRYLSIPDKNEINDFFDASISALLNIYDFSYGYNKEIGMVVINEICDLIIQYEDKKFLDKKNTLKGIMQLMEEHPLYGDGIDRKTVNKIGKLLYKLRPLVIKFDLDDFTKIQRYFRDFLISIIEIDRYRFETSILYLSVGLRYQFKVKFEKEKNRDQPVR